MNLSILSDLHIGASHDTYRRTREAVARIIRHHAPSEATVAILGDVTESGQPDEYRLALDALGPLIARDYRLVVLPGNHDFGPSGISYSLDAHQAFDAFREEVQGHGGWVHNVEGRRLVCVDSCHVPGPPRSGWARMAQLLSPARRFANGEIGAAQLDVLDAYLEDDMPTHILMHHHPLYVMPGLRLVDADAFWRVVRGRAAGIYFGHRHRPGIYDGHEGVPRVRSLGSTGHQGAMVALTI
jgi:3',5'-cyclic AMP phosphodiesterase CpdA